MENVIYNELRSRGYLVNVGHVTISKNNEDAQAINRLIKEHMTED